MYIRYISKDEVLNTFEFEQFATIYHSMIDPEFFINNYDKFVLPWLSGYTLSKLGSELKAKVENDILTKEKLTLDENSVFDLNKMYGPHFYYDHILTDGFIKKWANHINFKFLFQFQILSEEMIDLLDNQRLVLASEDKFLFKQQPLSISFIKNNFHTFNQFQIDDILQNQFTSEESKNKLKTLLLLK